MASVELSQLGRFSSMFEKPTDQTQLKQHETLNGLRNQHKDAAINFHFAQNEAQKDSFLQSFTPKTTIENLSKANAEKTKADDAYKKEFDRLNKLPERTTDATAAQGAISDLKKARKNLVDRAKNEKDDVLKATQAEIDAKQQEIDKKWDEIKGSETTSNIKRLSEDADAAEARVQAIKTKPLDEHIAEIDRGSFANYRQVKSAAVDARQKYEAEGAKLSQLGIPATKQPALDKFNADIEKENADTNQALQELLNHFKDADSAKHHDQVQAVAKLGIEATQKQQAFDKLVNDPIMKDVLDLHHTEGFNARQAEINTLKSEKTTLAGEVAGLKSQATEKDASIQKLEKSAKNHKWWLLGAAGTPTLISIGIIWYLLEQQQKKNQQMQQQMAASS
jgi:hypothetical protein